MIPTLYVRWSLILAVSATAATVIPRRSGAAAMDADTLGTSAGPAIGSALVTGAVGSADPVLPSGSERLLEQIETARTGLLAAQASAPARLPAQASPQLTPLALLGGGIGLIGCGLGTVIGAGLYRRRRSQPRAEQPSPAPADRSADDGSAEGTDAPASEAAGGLTAGASTEGSLTGGSLTDPSSRPAAAVVRQIAALAALKREVRQERNRREARELLESWKALQDESGLDPDDLAPVDSGAGAAVDAAADREGDLWEQERPAVNGAPSGGSSDPERTVLDHDAVEQRLRTLERSLLEVLRAVEAVAARIPPEPVAAPASARVGPDESVSRGPGADRDLRLPPVSTLDGRDLSRIRNAVLRLSAEGWDSRRIAQRLRLGSGDVALMLKSGGRSGSHALEPSGTPR